MQQQDHKISKLTEYLFSDKTADITDINSGITGEGKTPSIKNGSTEKHLSINDGEKKFTDTPYKAHIQPQPQLQRRHRGRCHTC